LLSLFPFDSKLGLFSFHSPLLWESLLVSFPPLTDMLKFSGYSRLSSGRKFNVVSEKKHTNTQSYTRIPTHGLARCDSRGVCPGEHYDYNLVIPITKSSALPRITPIVRNITWIIATLHRLLVRLSDLYAFICVLGFTTLNQAYQGIRLPWCNVHSKLLCSRFLQFTLFIAVSCVLHRPTSRVIHR